MANNNLAERYAHFVVRHRRVVILITFGFTLLFGMYVNQINLRNDPDSLLPLSNPYIATNLYTELTYGMGNLMVWGMKVREGDIYQPWFIRMVHQLYQDVTGLDYANADNFIGLASSRMRNIGVSADGSLDFSRLIPSNGLSGDSAVVKQQLDYLRQGLEKHLVLETLLVYYEDAEGNKCDMLDANGLFTNASMAHVHENCMAKGTFIIGDFSNQLKEDSRQWIAQTKALMAEYEKTYGDRVEFLVSGEPYFLASMIEELWNKAWLIGVSLLIILLVLWYEFRHWSCAVLPLLGVGMTIILTLGLMGMTQFKLTTMMALTPMLLLAIGIGHSMQITRRFLQELGRTGNPEKAALESIKHTIVPASLSIGTDLHGFFAISFVDISFYKAYAYFGIFGMSTLILTTTTLIPLLMISFTPSLKVRDEQRPWEKHMANGLTALLTGPLKWIPLLIMVLILWASAHYTELSRGIGAILANETMSHDPEVSRIQEEFDIMPGVEKGIHYPRAAFKDHYLLGALMGGNSEVQLISDLNKLSQMMPGVISANLVIRSKAGVIPSCGEDAWNDLGERVLSPDVCHDDQEDPPQGIFNDADVLQALSNLEDWLRSHPYIGFTTSYVQFIKTLNMVLNTPAGDKPNQHVNLYAIPTLQHMQQNHYAYVQPDEPDYLPDPDAMVQLYNGMLLTGSGAGVLDNFIDTQHWDEGIIIGFVNTMDPAQTHQTIVDIQEYLIQHQDDPGMRKLKIGIKAGEQIKLVADQGPIIIEAEDSIAGKPAIGGFLGVTEATRDVAFQEWLHAPLATSATVFAMTAIMFRSWMIAGILILLCFMTLMSQYGLAGYMTSVKEWSANLAFHVQVALSIAMGLGIDYAVYMVARLREEMQAKHQIWKDSLRATLGSTGSAVMISVVILLSSFIPLMNTELSNLWSVSLYIAQALILDVFAALILLPLLIYWIKPRFVFRSRANNHLSKRLDSC